MPVVTSCAIDRDFTEMASLDKQLMGTYRLRYKVQTDGSLGPISILNGAAISAPQPIATPYATYSFLGDTDPDAYAQEFGVERAPGSTLLYLVNVTYSPLDPDDTDSNGDPVGTETNPLLRSPVFWWDREVYSKLVHVDKDKKAIVNPLGEMYENEIHEEYTRGVLVAEYNVASLGDVIFFSRQYERAVNQSTWFVGGNAIPPRCAVCREVSSGPPMIENGVTFYRLSFRIAFSDDGLTFDHAMVETGNFHWTKDEFGEYEELDGKPKVTVAQPQPALLKADGTLLDYEIGDPAVVKEYRIRREVNFNGLPFSG